MIPKGSFAVGDVCTDEASIGRRAGPTTGLVVCQLGTWRGMATTAASGDACVPEGSMAAGPTGASLLCVNGAYKSMDTIIKPGTPGQACLKVGTTAIDTANDNETLLCKINSAGGGSRYMRLRDLTQNLSFLNSYEVIDSQDVIKPTCLPAAGEVAYPVIQLIPKTYTTRDGGVNMYAVDGASWSIRLRDGAGNVLAGTPTAIAQTYCFYP